jgi:two-component system nitrate/nitrite sensor histidine kinase NarX
MYKDNEINTDQSVARIIRSTRLIVPLMLTLLGIVLLLLGVAVIAQMPSRLWQTGIFLLSAILIIAGLVIGIYLLRKQLLFPLVRLQSSVSQVCQGEPGARILHEDLGVLQHLSNDIDSVYEELSDLYEDMDNRVERQTRRLAQKTASLKILYDVAATINQAESLDAVLLRFLRILKEMTNAKTATVRLLSHDGSLRLVGAIGLDNKLTTEQELLPVKLCLCGKVISPAHILCEQNLTHCMQANQRQMFSPQDIDIVSVPLKYHEDVLGVYALYVERPGIAEREDIMDLLNTIGSHLGMAVAKQRSDEEARRLSIVEERTALAHELHDSLAQTLAGLRYQVRMIADSLINKDDISIVQTDLDKVKNGLDEANTELRALLGNFRAPIDQRGLMPALRRTTDRFAEETAIQVFLQVNCRSLRLHPSEEIQIVRIVQESLANIRKHANAHMVRVMLTCKDGMLNLLIEDDGVGFEQMPSGSAGEHIGLSIMEERARRLGAELRIESEPGEGTRVEMLYRLAPLLANAGDAA